MLRNLNASDSATYGCAVKYESDRTSAVESTFITVLATCPVLEDPEFGEIVYSGPATDQNAEVRIYPGNLVHFKMRIFLCIYSS